MDPKIKPKPIKVLEEIAVSPDGERLFINFALEDGSPEWLSVDHTKIGNIAATLVSAAAHAARLRPKLTPGGNSMPQRLEILKPYGFAVGQIDGQLVLQVVLDEAGEARVNYLLERTRAVAIGQSLLEAGQSSGTEPPATH